MEVTRTVIYKKKKELEGGGEGNNLLDALLKSAGQKKVTYSVSLFLREIFFCFLYIILQQQEKKTCVAFTESTHPRTLRRTSR